MDLEQIENITVSVRIRPLNQRETSSGGEIIWLDDSISTVTEKSGNRSFTYDKVYPETTETTSIFSFQGVPVIQKCLSGYNGCIFCYGQTGSGKTHTMHGIRKSNPGMVPLSIDSIFQMIESSKGKEFLIRCSYIELYNEAINDLLNPNLLNLQLAEDKKSGIKIIGVTEEVCTSPHQVFTLLQMGDKHKNVASTNYNQRSSRAHCIFRIVVESKNINGRADVNIAALNLIDLAGSESADVHGPAASSARSKEMKYINRSLLTLGTVIMRLSDKKNNTPIPYRDSKLTRLLQPALEGDSKVSIICNISPCNDAYDETLSTLKFAQRAKKIRQTIAKNEVDDSKALIVKYEREISELQDKLREMETKLTTEEKLANDLAVSSKLIQLQEEKEKADEKLDRILQEKLKLSEELGRLRSFIICADDLKGKREEKKEELTKANTYRAFLKPETGARDLELSPRYDRSTFRESVIFDRSEFRESVLFDRSENRESMLIDGVDDIAKVLDELAPSRMQTVDKTQLSVMECYTIIDEQAREIEELKRRLAEKNGDDEKDRMITELMKMVENKDDKILELEDELKLCRNNLTRMQITFRNLKEKK